MTAGNCETTNASSNERIAGIDYIELFVGNVCQASNYYCSVWGFQPIAQLETAGQKLDRTSLVIAHKDAVFMLTGARTADSPVAEHLHLHGDGVAAIAFKVADVEHAYANAIGHGAVPVRSPSVLRDVDGDVVFAEVGAPDGFTHILVDRASYRGAFCPGFRSLSVSVDSPGIFEEIDHIAIAVKSGTLESWVEFYNNVFNFEVQHKEYIDTGDTAMNSVVVEVPSTGCKFPLIEPVAGKRESQVQVFLNAHNGVGVQHVALRTKDIRRAVAMLRNARVEFLRVPSGYYENRVRAIGQVGGEFDELRNLQILIDRDEWGHLLQIFARPSGDRSTLFFEIVERRGAHGFGSGNIRALFEAVERDLLSSVKEAEYPRKADGSLSGDLEYVKIVKT